MNDLEEEALKTQKEFFTFNSKGNKLYLIRTKPKLFLHEYKLAFSWNVKSVYDGSKLLYLLKRFFTAWRVRNA